MKDIETIIIEALLSQKKSVSLPCYTGYNEIKTIIRIYMRNHPEVFWFSHQYIWDENTCTLSFKYNFSPRKKAFFAEEIDNAVAYLFQPDRLSHLSELEKVEYVYGWIASNTTYNEYSSFNQTIYSVLINRNSVCTGYAKTAQYLLGLINVESQLVFGKFHSDESQSGRHCWNIVKIDGVWYHVDFCMADLALRYLLNSDERPVERNGLLWNYFCTSSEYILRNRSVEFIESYPECNVSIHLQSTVPLLQPLKQLAVCKSDSGSSAKVYLDSFDKDTVIKIPRDNHTLISSELDYLRSLEGCKHIVKFKGCSDEGIKMEQLTPWSELLNSHYYHPDNLQLKDILVQLTIGLIECRDKGFTYSDIHYNNVFVSKDGTYKWGDFGVVFNSSAEGSLPPEMIGSDGIAIGSRWFMAPETFHNKVFLESSAIYSLAMMAYFVMNDMRPPFWVDEDHKNGSLSLRLNGKAIPQPVFVDRYQDLWTMIRTALDHSVNARPHSYEDFLRVLSAQKYPFRKALHAKDLLVDYICHPVVIGSLAAFDGFAHATRYSECNNTDDEHVTDVDVEPVCETCPIVDNYDVIAVDIDHDGAIDECGTLNIQGAVAENIDIVDIDLFAATMGRCLEDDGDIYDADYFASTCRVITGGVPSTVKDDFAITRVPNINYSPDKGEDCCSLSKRETYGLNDEPSKEKRSIWNRIFGKKEKLELINASVYAPAEITSDKNFIVRIFLHKPEEANYIDQSVKDVDTTAVKKANKPLDVPVKEGDKLTVKLSMTDGIHIDEPIQDIVWRGRYNECDFICKLTNKKISSVWGKAIIAINNVPRGHLKFEIDVVSTDRPKVYAPVEPKRYSKIFISYAHADYSQVRGIAEGCRMNGSDYFFDRHTLKAGDIFKDKILQYIDNADLFVLCWSKNAAESEWVQIERKHALDIIERGNQQLAIYPLSMPPEAPLPEDMSDKYNFATL